MIGYKYRSINKNSIDSIINNTIYFSKYSDFNDPFEFSTPFPNLKTLYTRVSGGVDNLYRDKKLSLKNYIQLKEICSEIVSDARHDLDKAHARIKKMMNTFGIYCLSEVNDEILMWSHYADNHRGFCIGFNSLNESFTPRPNIFKLNYTEEYSDLNDPSLVLEFYEEMYYQNAHLPESEWHEKYVNLMKKVKVIDDWKMACAVMTDKSSRWAYEREFRLISRSSGLKTFKPEHMESITFGLRTSHEDRKQIMEACRNSNKQHVKYFQAKKAPGGFGLEIHLLT